MKIYGPDAIRNVAFVGHGASGKTTLVDALAFVSGTSRRHGSIKDGSTLTDSSPDEIDRKHSISLGVGLAEWMDAKINLLDTPGYLDFFGEVICGLSVADAAVVVLSGVSGVEVGTEKMLGACDHYHLPRILFVSGMDKDHANFERVFSDIREHLTPKVLPVEIPVGDGLQFRGIINLFTQTCQLFKPGSKAGEYEEVPVPAEYQEAFARYAEQMTEAVAATDDALLEKYLAGESIPREEVVPGDEEGDAGGRDRPAVLRQWRAAARGTAPADRNCRAVSRRLRSSSRRSRRRWWAGCSRRCPSLTWATSRSSDSTPAPSEPERKSGTPSTAFRKS